MSRAKIIFPVIFFIPCFVFAYDGYDDMEARFSIGIGLELNVNARQQLAGGAALSFDANFGKSLAAGIIVTGYTDFRGRYMLEPVALLRWYFLKNRGHTSWFVQADLGAHISFKNEELDENKALVSGGLRVGLRIPLGRVFLLEPYVRAGYPFMLCFGITSGFRF